MATTEKQTDDFAITPSADRLLSEISGDFGEIVLMIAKHHAKKTMVDGSKLVESGDVQSAIIGLCNLLNNDEVIAAAPPEVQEAIFTRTVC